jgi:hypothetical protein
MRQTGRAPTGVHGWIGSGPPPRLSGSPRVCELGPVGQIPSTVRVRDWRSPPYFSPENEITVLSVLCDADIRAPYHDEPGKVGP